MRTEKTGNGNIGERSLLISSLLALLLLVLGLAITNPANAAGSMSGPEKLRRLDLMLMVTGLRCRTTRDDFQADYSRFVSRHRPTLRQANDRLRAELGACHGPRRARWAFDRLSTSAANRYGLGHPWLGCGELGRVARNLAKVKGGTTLEEAADQLLAARGSPRLAYARP